MKSIFLTLIVLSAPMVFAQSGENSINVCGTVEKLETTMVRVNAANKPQYNVKAVIAGIQLSSLEARELTLLTLAYANNLQVCFNNIVKPDVIHSSRSIRLSR